MSQASEPELAVSNIALAQELTNPLADLMTIPIQINFDDNYGVDDSESKITKDDQPMNAQNDYVILMSKDEMPPAKAFWSLTLYDSANGFFIPNDSKKYSVGENAGMKLNADGGIDIYVAASKPDGVPAKNWLPINRKNEPLDIILRMYVPDLEKFKTYTVPKAEMIAK